MHDHKGPQLIQIAPLEGTIPQRPPAREAAASQKPRDHNTQFVVGLEVG